MRVHIQNIEIRYDNYNMPDKAMIRYNSWNDERTINVNGTLTLEIADFETVPTISDLEDVVKQEIVDKVKFGDSKVTNEVSEE